MKFRVWAKVNLRNHLSGDVEMLYEELGPKLTLLLLERMPSISIYFSTKPMTELKRAYIQEFCKNDSSSIRSMALQLKVSERFVVKCMNAKKCDACHRKIPAEKE